MKRLAILVLAAAASGGAALADTPVNMNIPFSGGTVSLEMIAGELTVEGYGGRDVELTGVLRSKCEDLDIHSDEGGVSIEVEWVCDGKTQHGRDGSELTLRVPRDAHVEIETISAGARITGLEGRLEAETISGTLDVRVDSRELDLGTVSGSIILVADRPVRDLDMESVSGSLRADVDPDNGASLDLESVSGSIVLKLPSGVSADFDVSSFSGSIRSDFGVKPTKTSKYLPSKELRFSVGGGSAAVSVETLSGSISLEIR